MSCRRFIFAMETTQTTQSSMQLVLYTPPSSWAASMNSLTVSETIYQYLETHGQVLDLQSDHESTPNTYVNMEHSLRGGGSFVKFLWYCSHDSGSGIVGGGGGGLGPGWRNGTERKGNGQ